MHSLHLLAAVQAPLLRLGPLEKLVPEKWRSFLSWDLLMKIGGDDLGNQKDGISVTR